MNIKKRKKKRKDKPGRDKKPDDMPAQRFTSTTRVQFLALLAFKGNVTYAAVSVGVTRQTAYSERRRNETFKQEWNDALQIAYDGLEFEARRRAVEGVLEPVFQKGEQVGSIRKYSDRLLIVLMRAARPERFNDRLVVGVDDSVKELQQERLVVEKALADPQLLQALRAVDAGVKRIECTVTDPKETIIEQRHE